QRLTAGSIEDMEMVTRRMADALSSRRDAEKVATVDNITQGRWTTSRSAAAAFQQRGGVGIPVPSRKQLQPCETRRIPAVGSALRLRPDDPPGLVEHLGIPERPEPWRRSDVVHSICDRG